jgi:hypothetical protein
MAVLSKNKVSFSPQSDDEVEKKNLITQSKNKKK